MSVLFSSLRESYGPKYEFWEVMPHKWLMFWFQNNCWEKNARKYYFFGEIGSKKLPWIGTAPKGKVIVTNMNAVERFGPQKVLFISMALKIKRMKQIWMMRSSLVPKMTAQRKMTLTLTALKAMSQILPWIGMAPKGKDIVPNMNAEKIFALKMLLICIAPRWLRINPINDCFKSYEQNLS